MRAPVALLVCLVVGCSPKSLARQFIHGRDSLEDERLAIRVKNENSPPPDVIFPAQGIVGLLGGSR